MKLKLILSLFLISLSAFAFSVNVYQKFDTQAYYDILKTGKLDEVDEELTVLNNAAIKEKEAYEGALLIRKAGLVKMPVEKLKLFKKGRIKLETALLNDSTNGEYHFLRLIIEEHAPKIVKYRADLDNDKQQVIKAYKTLPAVIRQAIVDYSKSSKILQPQDL